MGAFCDCFASDAKYNRSLCDGTIQRSAKAYPGLRHLRVLKDFGAKGTPFVLRRWTSTTRLMATIQHCPPS